MKSLAILCGLLLHLAVVDVSYGQANRKYIEYSKQKVGFYATKYYVDKRGMLQHVLQMGTGTGKNRTGGARYVKNNWRGVVSLSDQRGNSIYRSDIFGNPLGHTKRIGNRTYNVDANGKTKGYTTRIGNTLYYTDRDGIVKSKVVYWSSNKKKKKIIK